MTDQASNVVRMDDHRTSKPKPKHKAERINLTVERVAAAKPGERRYRIADAAVVGLHLVVQTTGAKSFVARGRISGGRTRPMIDVTLGSADVVSIADARKQAKVVLAKMRAGIDPRQTVADEVSVSRLIDAYLDRQRERGIVKVRDQERDLRRLARGLGQTPAHLVSKEQWATSLGRIHRAHGLSAAVEARKHARALMRWADDQGLVRDSDLLRIKAIEPTRAEKLAAAERAETKWTLRRVDWHRFWQATQGLDPAFGSYLRVLALTGLRRDEAASARWADIDLDARTWTIPAGNRKTLRAHTVHIGDLLAEVLEALPRSGELVFEGRGGVKMSGWSKRLARFGKLYGGHITLHGLRRGYRTALTELRADRDVSELMIGHARSGLEAIYDQSELTELRRGAQNKLEAAWAEEVGR